MSSSLKVNFNDQAAEDLKKIAILLDISESEVLRRALAVMRHYAKSRQKDTNNKLILKEGEQERELVIV